MLTEKKKNIFLLYSKCILTDKENVKKSIEKRYLNFIMVYEFMIHIYDMHCTAKYLASRLFINTKK